MPLIERQAVEPNVGTIAARLNETLGAVVARLAERLERPEPELVDVTVVRLDVIADRCRFNTTELCAILA
jgi:hypothetical protein